MSYAIIEDIAQFQEFLWLHVMGILASEGVIIIDRGGKLTGRGEFMTLPHISETSAPVRRDYSTTGQTRSFTEMSTVTEKGVVLRDDIADQYLAAQVEVSGADFQRFWLARAGLHYARRTKQQIYRVAKTAVEAMQTSDGTTPSVDCHINDDYSSTVNNTMTVTRLQDTKAKLGDAGGLITHCVMHSTCWNNLVKSGLSNYVVDSVAGRIIANGMIEDSGVQRLIRQSVGMRVARCDALGMVIYIDDDLSPISMTGGTYTYKSKYETLFFGPGSIIVSYQRQPLPTILDDIDDARGKVIKMRSEWDYCVHVPGIKWNSATANPTDVQLATKSNWEEAYTDHRQVLLAKLITNG